MGTAEELILVGGGEHARVVADAAGSSGWRVVGYVALAQNPETEALANLPYLGRTPPDGGTALTLVIGRQDVRQRLVEEMGNACRWGRVIHPTACVAASAQLGEGTQVLAGAVVNVGAKLGRHVLINTGSIIEHDCVLEDFTQVAPGVVIGGGTRVGAGSYLGLGAKIRDHIRIGCNVRVAMGAVVVADVPDNQLVAGVPARPRPDLKPDEPT